MCYGLNSLTVGQEYVKSWIRCLSWECIFINLDFTKKMKPVTESHGAVQAHASAEGHVWIYALNVAGSRSLCYHWRSYVCPWSVLQPETIMIGLDNAAPRGHIHVSDVWPVMQLRAVSRSVILLCLGSVLMSVTPWSMLLPESILMSMISVATKTSCFIWVHGPTATENPIHGLCWRRKPHGRPWSTVKSK